MQLSLARDGAQLFPKLAGSAMLLELKAVLSARTGSAGVRIVGDPMLQDWICETSPLLALAISLLGAGAQPVRAILFDKTEGANWGLGWHQDRTIAVRKRIGVDGFDNWTTKAGTPHVEPPFAILERMITMRVHLDKAEGDNGPLLIVPASHRLGRLAECEIGTVVEAGTPFACLASAGDIWVYATPIVHASEASRRPASRRVLQIDFSAEELPGGLQWAGID